MKISLSYKIMLLYSKNHTGTRPDIEMSINGTLSVYALSELEVNKYSSLSDRKKRFQSKIN